MKILLVEDSPTLRHATCTYIRKAGHDPVVAKCGEEALQIVDKNPIDLIIMDVEMPGLDGFETTRLIREWLGSHWVPIIFVTAHNQEESLREGIEAGGDDYLIKPVSSVILSAKIRAMERIVDMRNKLNQANEELTFLSEKDSLSGLYNRRTFDMKAEEHWKLATRSQEPVSLLLLDIDHFKLYNDEYGHQSGDECIRLISTALRRCLNRPGDIVARYGGEEFIALLPNTPEAGALHVAEHVRKTIEALHIKHRGSRESDRVTVSVGLSLANFTTGTSLSHQISLADKALYKSKRRGRNQVTLSAYTPDASVLVVDDDPTSLSVIEKTLEGHCALITTQNGEECLRLAQEMRPDVILIDVYLPGVNGYELCRSLKDNAAIAETPVILISVCEEEELLRFGRQVEANACLQKPLDRHQLIAKIRQYID
ncbi:response regulator [Teredinibacter purpureus]|uniref:response regulator n=1 Tax=Teredinibacter purpureus TaxID=2731756 RepID=UPI0005F7B424|nr:response regulator [Teredinibacter purpureus]